MLDSKNPIKQSVSNSGTPDSPKDPAGDSYASPESNPNLASPRVTTASHVDTQNEPEPGIHHATATTTPEVLIDAEKKREFLKEQSVFK